MSDAVLLRNGREIPVTVLKTNTPFPYVLISNSSFE